MGNYKNIKKYAVYTLIVLFLLITGFILFKKLSSGNLMLNLKKVLNTGETIIDYTRDGPVVYTLVSREGDKKFGDLFVAFHKKDNGGWERFYENDFKNLKPWKIDIADIDGNADKEILIAVKKTTALDPTEKNRMFVFNFINNKLVKKWTGSQIAGIWRDFYAGDIVSIPGNELLFIEKTKDGSAEQVSIYYWYEFGFLRLAISDEYPLVKKISVLGEGRLRISYKGERKDETVSLIIKDGKLIKSGER